MEISSIGRRILTAVPSTGQLRVGWIAYIGDAPAQYSHLGDNGSGTVNMQLIPLTLFFKYEKRVDLKVTLPFLQKQGPPWVTCADRDPDNQIMLTKCRQSYSMCRDPDLYRRLHLYIQTTHQSRGICRLHTHLKGHQWAQWSPSWPFQHSFAAADRLNSPSFFLPNFVSNWIKGHSLDPVFECVLLCVWDSYGYEWKRPQSPGVVVVPLLFTQITQKTCFQLFL